MPSVSRLFIPLLLLPAAAGCSALGDAAEEASRPPIEEPEDLAVLCEDIGSGYEGAAPYSGEGPHPAVMFFSGPSHDTDDDAGYEIAAPNPESKDDATPIVSWHPDSLDEAELLVCAKGGEPGEELRTCEFSGSGGSKMWMSLRGRDYSFTVYELATGEVVHETEFSATLGVFPGSGLNSECPTWVQSEETPTELYASPSADELHELLADVVEGAAG
ncbi:hypothetical protein [Nocardiopsis composta]|uniref:Lipoprotein n=1 Tax=Nocardiopsis composta TaxID=157465 RepID=A0A7W8QHF5_9ACTN|nr:hypothetical protein [Nocardiopsis composta]MBB5430094.1 hypothetical protein [Nocardiopsis composta]